MSRASAARAACLALTCALALALSSGALAGTGGAEFTDVVDTLQGWATGGLGQVISLAAVLIGAIISVVRSNPMPILSGIAFAMILNFTPGIVVNLLTGTI